MVLINVSTAKGKALNYLVAKCEDWSEEELEDIANNCKYPEHAFSTNISDAWPIIEREGILVGPSPFPGEEFAACIGAEWSKGAFIQSGPTGIVAAMRCYVTSKLGSDVEAPDALA